MAPGERRDAGALALRDGTPVAGRVSDDGGTPVPNARVSVSGQVALADGGGRFTVAVAPGHYTVAVSAPDLSERTVPVDVVEGQVPAPLEIVLARADKHNALNPALIFAINEDFTRALKDDCVKVIVLAADGRNFSAGHDIAETVEQYQQAMQDSSPGLSGWSGSFDGARRVP